jgi:hypothetical protein
MDKWMDRHTIDSWVYRWAEVQTNSLVYKQMDIRA